MRNEVWPALVQGFACGDLATRLAFYTQTLDFGVRFERREPEFVCSALGQAFIMLQLSNENWAVGKPEPSFGRGINVLIPVENRHALKERLVAANWPLFRDTKVSCYRRRAVKAGQSEFLVQDPDGYLLRCSQHLGSRPTEGFGE